MNELHMISGLLIERETIDKDQFERLLAGEPPEQVFADDEAETPAETPKEERRRRPQPSPRPFPLPGALSQPPPEPS
jgi:cell division protease FtsH